MPACEKNCKQKEIRMSTTRRARRLCSSRSRIAWRSNLDRAWPALASHRQQAVAKPNPKSGPTLAETVDAGKSQRVPGQLQAAWPCQPKQPRQPRTFGSSVAMGSEETRCWRANATRSRQQERKPGASSLTCGEAAAGWSL